MKTPLKDRCKDRWLSILPLVGIGREFLKGKHGPCPMCGGKDRFRFINRDGNGAWVCNQCAPQGGDGAELVKLFLKLDFKNAALTIEAVLGDAPKDEKPRQTRDEKADRAAMVGLWNRGLSIDKTPAARYLRYERGLMLDEFPSIMRFVPDCPYDDRDGGRACSAIVAKVIGPDNKGVNLHRTFITPDGRKATLDPARKLMRGALPPGSAIRLFPSGPILGVAEGIETALAAHQLFGVPVWALLNALGIERFVIPEGVEKLLIFADRDATFTGERSAYILANRAVVQDKVLAEVHIPSLQRERAKEDWNDVVQFKKELALQESAVA